MDDEVRSLLCRLAWEEKEEHLLAMGFSEDVIFGFLCYLDERGLEVGANQALKELLPAQYARLAKPVTAKHLSEE